MTTLLRASLLVALFILFNPSTTFAQKKYQSGEITKLDGQVEEGFINYQNWVKNPNSISFKLNENGTAVSYKPTTIRGFRVANESYESATVQVENSPVVLDKLSKSTDLQLRTETVFLQTMFKGEKSLFHFKNEMKSLFYIQEGEKYILLKYKKYLYTANRKNAIREYKEYISQLSQYLRDCQSIQRKLSVTKYKLEDIEKLFLTYYKCLNTESEFQRESEKVFSKFGILAGVTMTTFNFSSDVSIFNYLTKADFTNSVQPTLGITYEFFFPRNFYRISLISELTFSRYDIDGLQEIKFSSTDYFVNSTNFNFSYINLNPLFRYRILSKNNLDVFVELGISAGLRVSHSTSRTTFRSFTSTSTSSVESEAIVNSNFYENGVLAGVGLRSGKISGQVRCQFRTGLSPFRALSFNSRQLSLVLGYQL